MNFYYPRIVVKALCLSGNPREGRREEEREKESQKREGEREREVPGLLKIQPAKSSNRQVAPGTILHLMHTHMAQSLVMAVKGHHVGRSLSAVQTISVSGTLWATIILARTIIAPSEDMDEVCHPRICCENKHSEIISSFC